MTAVFLVFVFVVAVLAGAVASITGFGIGSLLTPTIGLVSGTRVAVAAVALPHFLGTALRLWMLRSRIDRAIFVRFGLASAIGGLTGALLHGRIGSPWLSAVFGGLLLFVAISEFTGLARKMRFSGAVSLVAGALSGLLGGLVGNQGGIRSAALLGFEMSKTTFVATATAVGLVVDLARMPVYLATDGRDVAQLWPMVAVATAGVIVGTLYGKDLLGKIPESRFRTIVAVILAVLGVTMLMQAV